MLLNKLKPQLKSNKLLYNLALTCQNALPSCLVYSNDYFYICSLLKSFEKNKGFTDVFRSRLSYVLKESLTNVPYYKETVHVNPNSINDTNAFDVLQSFPYLDKKVVMDHKESFLNLKFTKKDLIYGTSGGSTGQGIGIWQSKREIDTEKAFFHYEWGKLGFVDRKSKIVRFGTEARKKDDEIPWELKGNRLLISPYHLNHKWIDKIYERIIEFKPDFFHTYPSCVEALARYMAVTNKPKLVCKGLLLASEAFLTDQYFLLKKTFVARILAHYGLSERTNLAFMRENSEGDGFHYELNPLYGFSENLVDEFGNHEIIGTSYWNTVMPLIRYKTQDFGKIENGTFKQLDGRKQEFLITRKGEKIPGFSIKIDEFTWDYVDIYQVVQEKIGEIILMIVPKKNYSLEIEQKLLLKQLERWGEFFDIRITVVPFIERTKSGKFRLIVNKLKSA